jgi:methyl-accepting chemotaxis protein
MSNDDIVQKANNLAAKAKGLIDSKTIIVQSLATTMRDYESIDETERRPFYTKMLREAITSNKSILSVWSIWEPNSIDEFDADNILAEDATGTGSYLPAFYRDGDEVKVEVKKENPPYDKEFYTIPRSTKSVTMLDPYYFSYNKSGDSILVMSVIAPIVVWDEFVGVVGIDFSLDYIQISMSEIETETGEQIYIVSENGKYVYSTDYSLIGQQQTLIESPLASMPRDTVFIGRDINDKMAVLSFKKINMPNTNWYTFSTTPLSEVVAQANKAFANVILLILAGFILLSIVISIVARNISNSIVQINNKLANLSLGIIDKEDKKDTLFESEITDLTKSLDKLFDSLQASVDFAGEIGKGNLDTKYNLLSDGDTLGESLITMQKSLIKAKKEEEKKKILDNQRNWVTHGLANFGEIIRQDNDNINDFAHNLLSQLLQYVDVVQGAMYFKVEDKYSDELKFENKAAIAYGKQIMLDTTVTEKDGIFGRVIGEHKCIYLEDIPESYVSFTQGKKEAQKPRNLLIVPMVVNDDIFGILELVSYNHIEQYKIEFIEKLCENIASVISSVNTNIHNAYLLQQSNEQADELSQHEEEMRQNLEEMQATQEEAAKRKETLEAQIGAFHSGLMTAELDLNGNIISMSKNMTSFYGINSDNLMGMPYITVVAQDDSVSDAFSSFWKNLLAEGKAQREQLSSIRGKNLRTDEFYKVVYKDDEPYRVIIVSISKNREDELKERLKIELQSYIQEHGGDEEVTA